MRGKNVKELVTDVYVYIYEFTFICVHQHI